MKTIVAVAITAFSMSAWSQGPTQGKGEPQRAQESAKGDQRGTEKAPLLIKVLPADDAKEKAAEDRQERKDKVESDRDLVNFTKVLAAVGFLQLLVFGYQAWKLRQTVQAAEQQSHGMSISIGQAGRSAAAMERVADSMRMNVQAVQESITTMRERTAAQMRAYLTVLTGRATYQETEKMLRFAVRPEVLNTGQTPAHNVRYRSKAAILPVPLPRDFALPELTGEWFGGAVLGPHQHFNLNAVVQDFVPEALIERIKDASAPTGLYAWGTVQYEDIFGETRYTNFCQRVFWLPDDAIYATYPDIHNDAN